MSKKDSISLAAILDAISKISQFTSSISDPDTFF
jgi:uncharacterized protein with HEPN domain